MIELKNISKTFDEHILFSNFNYLFEKGKSYAFVGVSGSGKTTLLNMIGKLEDIDDGEVLIDGKALDKIKEKTYFKTYISYIFQNHGLIENETIQKNLELAFIGSKKTAKEKIEEMKQALKSVNLTLKMDRKIFSLSGGEAQRVAIAKTILKNSPIILADEPTASLDEKNSREIVDLILNLKDDNKVIIIATHDATVYNRVDYIVRIGQEEANET